MMAKNAPIEYGLSFVLHPMHHHLVNWGHWAVYSGGGRGHCASIEWRWEPPQCWESKAHPVVVDHASAIRIERVLTKMPKLHRSSLVLWYAWHRTAYEVSRKCGLRHLEFDSHMRTSLNMVENLLTTLPK
jgi:DNA-directed RNA polymerase specialized sigma24 family protein